jgi:AcrR family transcriptional regulator
MGPIERKERERLALRRKILDAARVLFAEQGYEAVTMRTIAQAVEYSPRTLYLHFQDKEQLIRELCREDFHAFGEGFGKLLAIDDPLDRLRAAGLAYSVFAREHPNHYQFMFMTRKPVVDHPDQIDWFGDPEADAYAFVKACAAEALARGLLRPGWEDPDLASQIIWGALHGVLALHITHRDDPFVPWLPIEARVEGVLKIILDGLRAESPPKIRTSRKA